MKEFSGTVKSRTEDPDGFDMIRTLEIKGYRGHQEFMMTGLGRINLLVGKNNSGKTSVLEALHLLTSNADPYTLWNVVSRRGERPIVEGSTATGLQVTTGAPEIQVEHLFYGHLPLTPRSRFTVKTTNDAELQLTCRVSELVTRDSKGKIVPAPPNTPVSYGLVLETPTRKAAGSFINLTPRGTITYNAIETSSRRAGSAVVTELTKTQFISTESWSAEQLAVMWNEVALTDAEQRVISALKFIDPTVERIAPIVNPQRVNLGRGGFRVLKTGSPPVPLGTLGDGMWRILVLVIGLSQAKGGLLLVDEIDTGLHHSVMAEMWKLIAATSKELGVQVFATTHSRDCVEALAAICDPADGEDDVSIQRIEFGKPRAVAYSESEILQAKKHHIEVR